ncbi:MAG TPA: Gfo/Idh/MocA family oxidoreductase [Vicinamibacterales bacterium]|nr:Gfo/Idh/MocA family oxidoreductase [Vicinamibacterales bacterium]
MTRNAPIRVGVIGAGYWGSNLIRTLTTVPAASLEVVCDARVERLNDVAARFGLATTRDTAAVLERRDIEAIFIATPAETHAEIARECLMAGKHVFVEKPMTTTVPAARLLSEVAMRSNRILMVGHLFQYERATQRLIELVREGAIGTIRYTRGVRTSMSGTARLDTDIVWDALIHDAYVQAELFGRQPQRVLVVGAAYLRPPLSDVAFATFDFGDRQIAHLSVGWYALEKTRTLLVVGSDGMLAYDGLSPTPLKRFARRYEESAEIDAYGRHYWRWIDSEGEVVPVTASEPLRTECEHFLHCVATGTQPMSDARSGARAVEIIDACSRSVAAGGAWEMTSTAVGACS